MAVRAEMTRPGRADGDTGAEVRRGCSRRGDQCVPGEVAVGGRGEGFGGCGGGVGGWDVDGEDGFGGHFGCIGWFDDCV